MEVHNDYARFKKFMDIDQAEELVSILEKNNIDCKLVDNSPAFDVTFSGNTLQNEIEVFVKQADFEMANKVLDHQAEDMIEHIDQGHYLFEFTNDELYDILMKRDEWSSLDYKLAKKILIERGETISEDEIQVLIKKRIEDLKKPEEGQKSWIYIGYFLAFLGGPIGIFFGWYLWSGKKTLPNGQKVNTYNERDRHHGQNMIIVGVVCLIFWLFVRLFA